MVNKPDPEKTLSIKTKLILIAIMFIIINLIFYFGFDSTDEPNESKKSIELNDANQSLINKTTELSEGIVISINP